MPKRRWPLRMAILSLALLPFTAGAEAPPVCTVSVRQEQCVRLDEDLRYNGGTQACVQGPGACKLAE